ncbi:hypothetical protein CY658_05085 [Variovorax sp. RO1]|uniref:DUF2163 domain-containing protein n=1 Tax=Variovorax sp. RO1 TaxID=2066034 RepID=UPI000C717977|nr:DUF2163 domain-containing protein [Variovorax sp. RO1]PLC06409.1 hypothetical protein CY658_05085 [Variovorax sp. RO1]
MSKTVSIPLKAEYAKGTTTIARCWRFERRDGHVVTVTTCARDLLINGEVYRSKEGVNPTAIAQEASAAVSNSEVTGTMAAESVSEAELFAGLWDSAFVTVFEVNYRDLSMGTMQLQGGNIGDVKAGRSAFTAEVRGLTQRLQKVVGEQWTKNCPANFGDARCKFDVESLRVTGTLTSAIDLRTFVDSTRPEADDYFGAGLLKFLTGANAGVELEVYSYAPGGTFVLHLPMPYTVAAGDQYSVVPGCRKRFEEDCVTKYANWVNFRGAPHVPGNNKILGLGGLEGSNA